MLKVRSGTHNPWLGWSEPDHDKHLYSLYNQITCTAIEPATATTSAKFCD